MTTLNTMVKQCAGLVGTGELKSHEDRFIENINEQTAQGDNTTSLTERQINWLEDIYARHFVNG